MTSFWLSIPAPIRTVINVVLGSAVAAAVSYVANNLTGGAIDLGALGQAVLVAAMTALVRAINPADPAYGIGSVPASEDVTQAGH